MCVCCPYASGMTGILMCAAGLPVCLTRAPKPILHPPPINKSDMKPVPGINGMRRKTKKKHLRRGKMEQVDAKRGGSELRTKCKCYHDIFIWFWNIGNALRRETTDCQQTLSFLPSFAGCFPISCSFVSCLPCKQNQSCLQNDPLIASNSSCMKVYNKSTLTVVTDD